MVGNGSRDPFSACCLTLKKASSWPVFQSMPCLEVRTKPAPVVDQLMISFAFWVSVAATFWKLIHRQLCWKMWVESFSLNSTLAGRGLKLDMECCLFQLFASHLGKNWVLFLEFGSSGGASVLGIPCHKRLPRQETFDLFFYKSIQATRASWVKANDCTDCSCNRKLHIVPAILHTSLGLMSVLNIVRRLTVL